MCIIRDICYNGAPISNVVPFSVNLFNGVPFFRVIIQIYPVIKYARSDANVRHSDQSFLLCVGLSVMLCNTLPESCC